jgi:hypothetical protein
LTAVLAVCALFIGFLLPPVIFDNTRWGGGLRSAAQRALSNPAAPTTLIICLFTLLGLAVFAVDLANTSPDWGWVSTAALGILVGLAVGLVGTPAR